MGGHTEAQGSFPPQQLTPILRGISSPGRSTEDIIALFISITFVLDAVKGMTKSEYLMATCCRGIGVKMGDYGLWPGQSSSMQAKVLVLQGALGSRSHMC